MGTENVSNIGQVDRDRIVLKENIDTLRRYTSENCGMKISPVVWNELHEQVLKGKVRERFFESLEFSAAMFPELVKQSISARIKILGGTCPVFLPKERKRIPSLGTASSLSQLKQNVLDIQGYHQRYEWLKKYESLGTYISVPEGFPFLLPLTRAELDSIRKMRPVDGANWLQNHYQRILLLKEVCRRKYIDALDFDEFRKMEPQGAIMILEQLFAQKKREEEKAKGLPA